MMHMKKRSYAMTLFAGVSIIIVSTLAAAIVLRNLGWIVEKFLGAGVDGKLDFVRIFGQTQHAQLSVHWLLPMLFGLLFFTSSLYLLANLKNRAARITLTTVIFAILLVAAFSCALLLTRVNGVRFGDLLDQLLPIINKL